MENITNTIAISRWKEHLPFTIPLTLLGYSAGINVSKAKPHLENLILILLANILAVSFAFIINEVEDAEDDKFQKSKKNPISNGLLSKRQGYLLSAISFLSSLFLFSLIGKQSFVVGGSLLLFAFLYSWKPIRLKAYPVVDILSHSLMLGGFLVLTAYLSQSSKLISILPIFIIVTFISMYGQFYNQIRDIKADKKAKLKNTTLLLGKNMAELLMYLILLISFILIAYSFYINIFPLWFIIIGITIFPIILLILGKNYTKRDKDSKVKTASFHFSFLIVINILAVFDLIFLFMNK